GLPNTVSAISDPVAITYPLGFGTQQILVFTVAEDGRLFADRSSSASPPTKVAGNHEIGWVRDLALAHGPCDSEAAPDTTCCHSCSRGNRHEGKENSLAATFHCCSIFRGVGCE